MSKYFLTSDSGTQASNATNFMIHAGGSLRTLYVRSSICDGMKRPEQVSHGPDDRHFTFSNDR